MRIALFDDLHTEFGPFVPKPLNCDVIVLAGDIATTPEDYRRVVESFHAANLDADIVGVAGNHEGYGRILNDVPAEYAAAVSDLPYMHFLEKSTATLRGYTFIGTTLWSDLSDPETAYAIGLVMNDYRKVRFRDGEMVRLLKPADIAALFEQNVEFIRTSLTGVDPDRAIVITHHAPSFQSVEPYLDHYDGAEIAYYSNLEPLIREFRPAMWLHGHVHFPCYYTIGDTLVMNNARGYVGHRTNAAFNDELVIEFTTIAA